MLIEARFQIGHARQQLGNLLLLKRDHREGRQEHLLYRHRCGSPVICENAGWWRACIHGDSMPAVSRAVK
jgi:hypothetical protein